MVRAEPSDHSWDTRSLYTQQQMGTWWNTGEAEGGEERNWPPHLTIPAAQDKCLLQQALSNVRNRIWD